MFLYEYAKEIAIGEKVLTCAKTRWMATIPAPIRRPYGTNSYLAPDL